MTMKRMAIAAVVVTALGSLGGIALAKTPAVGQSDPATSSVPTTSADTDNIQEGDQTTPDTGAEVTSEAGGERTTESGGAGGHEDPAGNVDHRFDGQE